MNVKKPTTRGLSAVVKNYSNMSNFEAIQRLNAGDLVFAYLVGLFEGDVWFSVTKNGKYIKYEFGIEMNIRDIQLLYKIKEILGVGTIDIRERNQRKTSLYRIRNKSHLKSIVLPIFDKYPMFSNKQYDYLMFKDLLLNELHFSKDLSNYVRPIDPLNSIDSILEKSHFKPWLIGFIEAEGCFSLRKSNNHSFSIGQNDDLYLIEAIQKYFEITNKVRNPYGKFYFLEVYRKEVLLKIITHCTNYPLLGEKLESLKKFSKKLV